MALILTACTAPRAPTTAGAPATTAIAAGVSAYGRADSQLSVFLSLSIATRARKLGMLDSVYRDDPQGGGDFQRSFMLADYRVLSAEEHGDTAAALAAITTVADMQVDPASPKWKDRIIGTVAVREDTVRWTLVRDSSANGRWQVLGDGIWARLDREKTNVAVELAVVPVDTWRSVGATKGVAFGLVDSIRRARGHSVIR